jgi:hypothetical protein
MALDSAPLSADSARRVRHALTEALLRERANDPASLRGPWNLLLEDCCTWRDGGDLSRELFLDLRGHFGAHLVREILLAAAGVKISRTCLADQEVDLLRGVAARHGFAVVASKERYLHHRDAGKGGSSNAVDRLAGPDEANGLRNVYIAMDVALAETGQMLEAAGDDENFGVLLGIPSCCRQAFIRMRPIVSAGQNDFVLPALDNTSGPIPYDPWLNYLANYFGPGLLSFFPCSFRCANAAAVAANTWAMLRRCDAEWAESFFANCRTNILYTEYDGLHLFRRPLVERCIDYGPRDFRSTESTSVSALVSSGSRLEVRGKHAVSIWRDSGLIASLEGPDIGMCAFY